MLTVEAHPDGVAVNRPVIVIRGGASLIASRMAAARAADSSARQPRETSAFSTDDRVELSPEGQARLSTLASSQPSIQSNSTVAPSPQDDPAAGQNESDVTEDTPLSQNAVKETPDADDREGQSEDSDASEQRGNHGSHSSGSGIKSSSDLSQEDREKVQELQKRDRKVRQHEQAHKSTAGQLAAGGPDFTYETGPDGNRYATGGEVKIAVGSGNTPEEKLQNARQAERAALAPAEPSPEDRQVAAEAKRVANEAEEEIQQKGSTQTEGTDSTGKPNSTASSVEQTGHKEKQDPAPVWDVSSDEDKNTGKANGPSSNDSFEDPTTSSMLSRVSDSYRNQMDIHQQIRNLGSQAFPGGLVSVSA